jgi:hypothetical protein
MAKLSSPIATTSKGVACLAVVACLAFVIDAEIQLGSTNPGGILLLILWLIWPYLLFVQGAASFRNPMGGSVYFLGMAMLCGVSLWVLHGVLAELITFDRAVKGGMKCAVPGPHFALLFLPLAQLFGLCVVGLCSCFARFLEDRLNREEKLASDLLTDFPQDTFQSNTPSPESIRAPGDHHVHPPSV